MSELSILTGRHPEQRADEAFLGNLTADSFDRCAWRTKRSGLRAYRIDGSPACHTLQPVFLSAAEAVGCGLSVTDGQVYSLGYEQFLRDEGILALAAQA